MSALLPDRLAAFLEKAVSRGALPPLWVVHGAESLLAIESCDAIRAAAKRLGAEDREVINTDAKTNWNQVEAAAASQSLFGDHRVVEVRMASKPGKGGEASLARLADRLEGNDSVTMIVEMGEVDWQTAKKPWWKALSARAQTVVCDPVPRARLPEWIAGRLARQGQSADGDAIAFMANQTEGNLMAAHQEVAKLAILGAGKTLTLEDVRGAILNVARYDPTDIEESVLAGDGARVARTVLGLKNEGEPMPWILWLAADLIRNLLSVQLGNAPRMAPSRARALERAARTLRGSMNDPTRLLTKALDRCADIDRISKGLPVAGLDTDPWTELTAVLVGVASKLVPGAQRRIR